MFRRLLILATLLPFLALATCYAQGHGGPPAGGGGMGGGMGHGGGMGAPFGGSRPGASGPHSEGTRSSGTLFGPASRWWNDNRMIRAVGLNSQQQKRMDEVFTSNRDVLVGAYKNFQLEQSQLDKLARAKQLDEPKIFQQIDRVNSARSDLEKASVHYQIELRKQLTDDQVSKLEGLRETPKTPDAQD